MLYPHDKEAHVRYEVVTTADEERGVYFHSREDAITIARSQGGEVWQLADDDTGTRMRPIWPEPAPSEATESKPASEVGRLVEQADRYAAAAMAKAHPTGYAETLNVVALAYAQGRRDGFHECARLVGSPLTASTEEPRRDEQ